MSPPKRLLVLVIATASGMWAQNLYRATTVSTSPIPGSSWAAGINRSGQVVGGTRDGIHDCEFPYFAGFLYSGGDTLGLDGPAAAINASGQIVGHYAEGSMCVGGGGPTCTAAGF